MVHLLIRNFTEIVLSQTKMDILTVAHLMMTSASNTRHRIVIDMTHVRAKKNVRAMFS